MPPWPSALAVSLLLGCRPGPPAASDPLPSWNDATTHTGMTTDEFGRTVGDWIASAKHLRTGPAVHQYGVSADAGAAGLPPRQRVQNLHRIGWWCRVHAALDRAGLRHPEPDRTAADHRVRQLRRRPSDAEWTTAGSRARFALFVHHDDAEREYAYDRADKLQQFDKGCDAAVARGWTVLSMKNDWAIVYPAEKVKVSGLDRQDGRNGKRMWKTEANRFTSSVRHSAMGSSCSVALRRRPTCESGFQGSRAAGSSAGRKICSWT